MVVNLMMMTLMKKLFVHGVHSYGHDDDGNNDNIGDDGISTGSGVGGHCVHCTEETALNISPLVRSLSSSSSS